MTGNQLSKCSSKAGKLSCLNGKPNPHLCQDFRRFHSIKTLCNPEPVSGLYFKATFELIWTMTHVHFRKCMRILFRIWTWNFKLIGINCCLIHICIKKRIHTWGQIWLPITNFSQFCAAVANPNICHSWWFPYIVGQVKYPKQVKLRFYKCLPQPM